MKKTWHSLKNRVTAMLLALICVLGLLPTAALAAGADTIKLERFGMSGVSYQSASLGRCTMHQMYYGVAGKTSVGFCGTKGGGMGTSLIGQTWGDPKPVTDPTVKMMMAYYYAHSLGIFTDKAHALGVDDIWDSGYSWYMNAWVQAIVWRYKDGSLGDPATACAEELMYVWNSLKGASYTSIDQTCDGTTFRDRAKYILDLGKQDVWGDCDVKEYSFTGAGSAAHPASTVQSVMIGSLTVTNERYTLVVKKVDATNPTKGLAGARFHVESTNGSFSRDIVTGADGTYTFSPLDAGTYAVTETAAPNGYGIDNAGPEYVVLPNNGSSTVTITFTDTPTVTATGKIRKVDADDPTRGLAGAVIKITGVDNNFTGTYTTGAGGALTDVPWDTMPIGSYVAEEMTPPNGYSLSKDAGKVRQEFYWDGKTDVSLVFENDAKVKIQLIKLTDANSPLPGAVFHVLRDGQLIGTEVTDASGKITVPHVTEGMYAFVEVSAPALYAKLTAPVCAHVDQATVNGGGTVTVTAKDQKLPNLTIQKLDKQTKQPIPGTVFEIKGIHYGYHQDVTTGPDGKAILSHIPVDSYEVKETSVPDPYVVGGETIQTIYLGPGDDQNLVFENLKMPRLTVTKIDAEDSKPIPGTVFTVEGIDSDFSADWTTGEDGTVTDRVAPGSYRVTEKSVPAPYYLPSKNADREQTVSLNAGDEVNVTFKNWKMPHLTIYKEDSVAGAPVEGAKFYITYTSSGESAEAPGTIDYGNILTDAKGEIRLHEQGKRLYPGEYTVTEVEPAPGFQMKEPSTQKIILHGSESKTLTFQNTPLNAIVVEKYDSVTHEALPGCTFQLRFLGGTSGTGGTTIGQKVTGKNGTAIWTGLKSGTYIVEEVDPADGYSIINASETIYLADSGEQSVVTVRFDNAPDGILLIRKVCSVNPSVTLANAEFKITYADGTLIGDANGIFRTDEHGEIRVPGLKPGKSVIVTETRAPDGYLIDTQSQTVQIKEGRTVSLTFKNQPKGKLIIQKRDSATGQPLPGAEFRVTTAAGCEVGLDGVIGSSTLTQNGIFTTDGQGEITITNLAPGAYVINEIKAPTGYVMDRASTNMVIGKNGDTQTVIVKNSKAGTLVIDKRDSLTGKPLQGVTFKVTTSTGEFVPAENGQISSNGLYFTDKDGKITIHGVVGTLVVTETATIPGYTIDEASRTQTVVVNPNDTQTLHFTNTPSTTLVIEKYIEGTTTPLKGVTFLVTDSSGAVVGRSNGEFITDENGRVVINDLIPGTTVTAREVKTVEGFVLDSSPKFILIKAGEVQTLRFYNVRAGGLTVIKKDEKTGERIPGVQFEIRKMDGEIVGAYTTDENGVIHLHEAENGWYTVTELKAADGYRLDDTPHRVEVRDGQTATLEITNKAISGILLHKVNAITGEGIYGVSFILYDSGNNPIAQETSDDRGYVRFENLTAGRYYLRELENEGYIPDTQKKTVYVKSGETTEIEWQNTPITGQIQVTKVSADYNAMNGWPAGTPIPNTVFEIYNARTNRLVDTIKTDKNGLAVSKPLPLAQYKIVESKAAEFYGLDKTPIEVEIEYAGQIVKAAMTNKSLSTNVSIKKTGYVEVMPGQLVRYNFTGIANNSTTALESFYWRDTLPVKAVRLQTIYTGTWNTPGNYKIVYRTNLSGDTWRTLADNLSTSKNYVLDASPAALGLAANEYVTEFMAAFGIVPANFRQVEAPRVDCKALAKLTGGTQFVNTSDAGGVYNGRWIMATSRWVTRVYAPSKPLPRTGY